MDYRLKGKRCDVCGSPATRWFEDTCVILCNDANCYHAHRTAFDEELQRLAIEEDGNED